MNKNDETRTFNQRVQGSAGTDDPPPTSAAPRSSTPTELHEIREMQPPLPSLLALTNSPYACRVREHRHFDYQTSTTNNRESRMMTATILHETLHAVLDLLDDEDFM